MKIDLVVTGYIIHENKVLLIHHKKLNLWLAVGGHIDENETPDQALLREIKEEVGIDVEILNVSNLPKEANVKYNLATPFYVNVHSVGDHDHCSLFYVCRAINSEQLKINNELKNFGWFTKDDLNKEHIPVNVKNECLKAFELYNSFLK
ncbi:MAG: NUDIX domain-containing protein [Candidatus Kerfeldbacteria bacterium]|nr:NUDIX domain-containing protein [Candidatus Kerfeldbacteria bacterium]